MYGKIKAGEPIGNIPALSAQFNNDCIDVIQAYKASELGGGIGNTSGLAGDAGIVQVRNLTGANRLRGHVVRIGDYLLNEDEPTKKWFEGNAVTTTFSPVFGLLTKPLVEDDIGPAQVAGVAVAVCDFTPVKGDGCGPKPSQSTLAKGFPGCIVLDVVDGPNKIAIVQMLTPIVSLLGKASGAITARVTTTPGTGTLAIWANIAGVLTDSTMTVAVKNPLMSALADLEHCEAQFIGGEWWIVATRNMIWHVTIGSVAAGASTSVTLGDGRSVTAINNGPNTLTAGGAACYQDVTDGLFYLATGGGSGGGGGSSIVDIEGYVYASFTKNTASFLAKVTRDDGDLLAADTQVSVLNFAKAAGSTKPYLFEGEFNASCFFRRDANESVYRAVWVECPENSPVQVSPASPGESSGFQLAPLTYSFGGL